VVEDHAVVAEGLELALSHEQNVEVVAVALSADEGFALIERTRPDVALVDYALPGTTGADLARRIRNAMPEVVIVMLTADESAQALRRSIEAGVSGFLLKTLRTSEIVSAIERCAAGDLAFPARALAQLGGTQASSTLGLSEREIEVLRFVADGLDPKAIAHALGLSVHTVRGHIQSILEKTGTHSKLEAVMRGLEVGILHRD
jgi:DNA-binding NarL/FixJ family response regulator